MQSTQADPAVDPGVLLTRGWLAQRPGTFRAMLLQQAQQTRLAASQDIYRIGDDAYGVFGIADGWVQISMAGDDGLDRAIHAAGPGFWIGDLGLLSGRERLVTVSSLTEVRAVFISTGRVQAMLRDDPFLYREIYALTEENTRTALRIIGLDRVSAKDRRLALKLVQLAEDQPGGQPWLPLTQDHLAALTATSLPSLRRALAALVRAGLVETGYAGLRVLDRAGLVRYGQS